MPKKPQQKAGAAKAASAGGRDMGKAVPAVLFEKRWRDDTYTGTREALIAAGHAKPEWFPAGDPQPGRRPGSTKRTFLVAHQGNCPVHLIEKPHNGTWELRFSLSPEERAAREAEAERPYRQQEYEQALAEEKKELDWMPTSHEHFRRQAASSVPRMVEISIESWCAPSKYRGHSYASEVLDQLAVKVQEIESILETGRTIFSAERQQARIAEVKSRTAKANPDLRAFLHRITVSK